MAIKGLRNPNNPNHSDLTDDVGVAVEALDLLELIEDREQVTETLAADFTDVIENSGHNGEVYVQLPRNSINLMGMIAVLDGAKYPKDVRYPKTYVYEHLWVPGAGSGAYSDEELGNLELGRTHADWPAHARLAVYNPGSPNEQLLHFLDQPFDEMYADKDDETQLEAIAKVKSRYEAAHEGFSMVPINAIAIAMIALVRRIKGESMPLEWGFMRDATLPRKPVRGVSIVGDVHSFDGQLRLRWSYGGADSDGGVGLSVGRKLESQNS